GGPTGDVETQPDVTRTSHRQQVGVVAHRPDPRLPGSAPAVDGDGGDRADEGGDADPQQDADAGSGGEERQRGEQQGHPPQSHRGTGTRLTARSTAAVSVTPAISASGRRTRRWRSTGTQRSLTSSGTT